MTETMVTAKFAGHEEKWFVSDYSFGDTWVCLSLYDGEEVHIYATSLEYLKITEMEDD